MNLYIFSIISVAAILFLDATGFANNIPGSDDSSAQELGEFTENTGNFYNNSDYCYRYPWMPTCQSDNYFDGGWSDGHYSGTKRHGRYHHGSNWRSHHEHGGGNNARHRGGNGGHNKGH